MPTRFPDKLRRDRFAPIGTASLFISRRIGPGSTATSDDVDVSRHHIKTFSVRGNLRGSFYIDATHVGTDKYGAVFEGTFPASSGTWTSRSFESHYRRMRMRVRLSAAGSASSTYAGMPPFRLD